MYVVINLLNLYSAKRLILIVVFEEAKKSVEAKEAAEASRYLPEVIEINEEKIDNLLHMLHEADPTNLEQDPEELLNLEREVNMMGV